MTRITLPGNARKQPVPRGDSTEEKMMQTNSAVEFNLGKFNVPTIVGLATIIGMLVNMTNNRTEIDTKVELRLSAVESARAAEKVEYVAVIADVRAKLNKVDGLEFKVEANKDQINATEAKLDRQSDAISQFTKGLSEVSSDLKLLTQRLEISVPLKKTQLQPVPFGQTPSELATTK